MLPAFSFPTTLVCIDDNPLFLKSIANQLDKHYLMKNFNKAEDCLSFFETYVSPITAHQFIKDLPDHDLHGAIDHTLIDFDFASFVQLPQDNKRKEEISVLLVDYEMPEMNGIELCQALKHLPIKKILLTAKIGLSEAIQALNDNTIDCYIDKDAPNLIEEIHSYLNILLENYFKEKTRGLLSHLEVEHLLPLSDPEFIRFFKTWCSENNITEYYLVDKSGTLLVTDKEGNSFYFIVHTERSLDYFALIYDEPEFFAFHDKLEKREHVPFFGPAIEPLSIPTKYWHQYFHKPATFKGRESYYWAVVRK